MKNLEQVVNELVKLLQEMPPDTPIMFVDDYYDTYSDIDFIYPEEQECDGIKRKVVILE